MKGNTKKRNLSLVKPTFSHNEEKKEIQDNSAKINKRLKKHSDVLEKIDLEKDNLNYRLILYVIRKVETHHAKWNKSKLFKVIKSEVSSVLQDKQINFTEILEKKVKVWISKSFQKVKSKKRYSEIQLARFIKDAYSGNLLYAEVDGNFRKYTKGYWEIIEEVKLRKEIHKYDYPEPKISHVNTVINSLKTTCSRSNIQPNPDLVCMLDKTINIRTRELIGHSPDHYILNCHDFEYKPEYKCPLWFEYLNRVFLGKKDKKEIIKMVKWWFGYCLTTDASKQICVFLYGEGNDGKSTFLEVQTGIIGKHNTSNVELFNLSDKYAKGEMIGKLLNAHADVSSIKTIDYDGIKSVVAADRQRTDRKYKSGISFEPYVKLIATFNKPPKNIPPASDKSFFRRLILLKFEESLKEKETKTNFASEILKNERADIFAWSLEGLNEFLEYGNKPFPKPQSCIDDTKEFMDLCNPVSQFCGETLIKDE
ncbi:MAG: hypothetical protein HOC42_01755, partial [Nitrospina sp.]|nr:hypothetical protein [Nitrospina sp.]